MKIGYLSLGENRFPGVKRDDTQYYLDYLALAEVVDQLGYHSFWTGEHHFAHVAAVSSPLVLLSAIAARTKDIRLATAVNVLSFHHPIRYAEDHATLDVISGGRAQAGIGVGYAQGEFEAFGRTLDGARELTHEVAAIAADALNTGRFGGVQGSHYKPTDRPLVPAPVQNPFPIYAALSGNWSTVQWAAENGFNLITSSQSPAATGNSLAETIEFFQRTRQEHGYGPGQVAVPFFTLVSRDEDKIAREFDLMVDYWKHLANDLGDAFPRDLDYWMRLKDQFARLTVEDLHNRQTAFGTPEKLVELFLKVAETGTDEVLIEPFYGPQELEESLRNARMFREEVMPAVDERFGGPKYGWDGEKIALVSPAANVLTPAAV
ncbi:LLM class flavin-dependent oxidoreductase [Microbacterium rhizophilus]|uniref:LLM class flavin-dependent oxidoreductase n=1 Tax=Microbacterium rhizophilus TaxID=3138934 RepID=UPI0031EEDF55